MRFWLSKTSDVSVKEQLLTQIMLAIVSDDLKPGQRLPSTREIARRYRIHPNTVSVVYAELSRRGWVEFRRGSGVYVRQFDCRPSADEHPELDRIIASFLQTARENGFSLAEIRSRIKQWLEIQTPDHFLIIEPDEGLRKILAVEIAEATGFPVRELTSLEDSSPQVFSGAAPVAFYGQSEYVRRFLPAHKTCIYLRARSIPESLKNEPVPSSDALITVISHWPEFLRRARAILTAAGIDEAALDFREAAQAAKLKSLRLSDIVVTDALTARRLTRDCRPRIFRIIADRSVAELQTYVSRYLTVSITKPGHHSKQLNSL